MPPTGVPEPVQLEAIAYVPAIESMAITPSWDAVFSRLHWDCQHIVHQANFFLHERFGVGDAAEQAVIAGHGFHARANFFLRGEDLLPASWSVNCDL
jgi:hypothetical protein